MRLHPGVAMMLERYVPTDGLSLPDGRFIPSQTKVGINPYVANRNKDVFGHDADVFRPERWLRASNDSDDAFRERLKLFNGTDLSFGNGSRVCLGRHIALPEAYKLVATLVNRYDIELTDLEKDWDVTCNWFLRQRGLVRILKVRHPN
jgi:cytochrome P450